MLARSVLSTYLLLAATASRLAADGDNSARLLPIVFTREDLHIQIVARYGGGRRPDAMGLRGNGLGLGWENTTLMDEIGMPGSGSGAWTYNVTFQSDERGFAAQGEEDDGTYLRAGEELRFRFYFVSLEEEDRVEFEMRGRTCSVPLPVSRVSSAFQEERTFEFYPYFFSREGEEEEKEEDVEDEKKTLMPLINHVCTSGRHL